MAETSTQNAGVESDQPPRANEIVSGNPIGQSFQDSIRIRQAVAKCDAEYKRSLRLVATVIIKTSDTEYTQSAIADAVGYTSGTVLSRLNELEDADLLERESKFQEEDIWTPKGLLEN